MASFSFIIGIIGNIISILVFASPIRTFLTIIKKKSTEEYKGIPYITTLLSTSLWTLYGLLKPDGLLVVTVNGAGTVLQFIYVTLFLLYAPHQIKIQSMKLAAMVNVGFPGVVVAITLVLTHGSVRLTFVGVLCAVLTIGMYASPLFVMRIVIKTKSVNYMPFSLSFFLFLNAGVWSTYAVLVKDLYIGVPNALGFVLGLAQVILYIIYKNKSKTMSTKSTEAMEQEGSTHLVKKGGIEMGDYNGDNDKSSKNRNIAKGRSLPKTFVSKQFSLPHIMKTKSLGLYELDSNWSIEKDIENGNLNSLH